MVGVLTTWHADMAPVDVTHAHAWEKQPERHQCVADSTKPISAAIDRSAFNEANRGASFSNRSTKAPDLGFERCGSVGRVNHEFRRSSDDLSIGVGGCLMRRLEARVPRLESYCQAWQSMDGRKQPLFMPKTLGNVVPIDDANYIYGLSSSLVNSQAESCSSNQNLNGSVPFDTTSLHCLAVWDSQGFLLRYLQTASNIWSFVLSAPADTNSYIAIGFSTSGVMVGSSAMVGWVSSNGGGVVKQYYLGGTSPNLVAPDQGKLQIVTNSTTIISQSSRLYLAFQLETNQPQSRLLYSVGPTNFFPSSPNYVLSEHRAKVSTSINYVTGNGPFGSARQGVKIAKVLELVPPYCWENFNYFHNCKHLLWNPSR
uniref:DOMON domain-containing protein n=1 Tax=Fagus sylvatica TaxID=28930 RepID=A0A2N9FGV6_FAGSY